MTDLSQKSDEELSRAIAEHIEPKPTWDKPGTGSMDLIVSRRGAWTIPETCITPYGASDMCYRHQPHNMVKDPAMTVMLLEKLPPGHVIDIEDDGTVTIFRYEDVVPCGEGRLGRAVCEAYAQAHRLF